MRLLALALGIFLGASTAHAIPANPGGINVDVVGCTGLWTVGRTSSNDPIFQVNCAAATVLVTTITVSGRLTPSIIDLSSTTIIITGSFPIGNYTIFESTNTVDIRTTLTCPGGQGRCQVASLDKGQVFIATGTLTGQWANIRTGTGP